MDSRVPRLARRVRSECGRAGSHTSRARSPSPPRQSVFWTLAGTFLLDTVGGSIEPGTVTLARRPLARRSRLAGHAWRGAARAPRLSVPAAVICQIGLLVGANTVVAAVLLRGAVQTSRPDR